MPSLSVSFTDYSDEKGTVTFPLPAVTASNFAQIVTDINALRTALPNLCAGMLARQSVTVLDQVFSQGSSDEPTANRELRWLVTYEGVTSHKLYRVELPTPDVTAQALRLAGTDLADLSHASWVAFVAAFEALVRVNLTEGVNVISARLVGRTRG